MFKKIIIADDLVSVNTGVVNLLKKIKTPEVLQVQYCDDAYLKIKQSYMQDTPFELLITDLSFVADHRPQKLISGEQLIIQVKKEFPKTKVIAYSVEEKQGLINNLLNKHNLDGFVSKGRKGLDQLQNAIEAVFQGNKYISPNIAALLAKSDIQNISQQDIILLQMLAKGMSQTQISDYFKNHKITPSSLSAIEKQLNKLREFFGAKNATQLVAITKDLGIL